MAGGAAASPPGGWVLTRRCWRTWGGTSPGRFGCAAACSAAAGRGAPAAPGHPGWVPVGVTLRLPWWDRDVDVGPRPGGPPQADGDSTAGSAAGGSPPPASTGANDGTTLTQVGPDSTNRPGAQGTPLRTPTHGEPPGHPSRAQDSTTASSPPGTDRHPGYGTCPRSPPTHGRRRTTDGTGHPEGGPQVPPNGGPQPTTASGRVGGGVLGGGWRAVSGVGSRRRGPRPANRWGVRWILSRHAAGVGPGWGGRLAWSFGFPSGSLRGPFGVLSRVTSCPEECFPWWSNVCEVVPRCSTLGNHTGLPKWSTVGPRAGAPGDRRDPCRDSPDAGSPGRGRTQGRETGGADPQGATPRGTRGSDVPSAPGGYALPGWCRELRAGSSQLGREARRTPEGATPRHPRGGHLVDHPRRPEPLSVTHGLHPHPGERHRTHRHPPGHPQGQPNTPPR